MIELYELIQKDNLINKYYTPFIKSKLDNNTEEFTKKIKELEKQKDRIKSAYIQGIVKMDEFGNELKSIEFNIEELNKKIKEQKQYENFNFTTNDLLILEDTKKIDELIYPDKIMENILSLTNSPREEMKRIIATYIDNIEVKKVGEQTQLKYIEYRKNFLADLVNFHNEYGVPCNWSIFADSSGSKIAMNHEGKTHKEAQEYFDKLKDTIKNDKLKLNYYEIAADDQLEDVGFIPNGDYEKVLRLIVLSDSKRYDDKTLRLGVITLDMESAILSRIGKTKEANNELCYI